MTSAAHHGLAVSYWTLAGVLPDDGKPSRWKLAERVAAAAHAGFTGVGLTHADYQVLSDRGYSDDDMFSILESYEVHVVELEFLSGWSSDDPAVREQARKAETRLYEVADALGGLNLNVGCSEPAGQLPPLEAVAERLAAICDRAKAHGLRVAVEFMPWTAIPDVATAWRIVEAAGRPNAGILLDAWHYFRGAADPAQLRAVPPEKIMAVQLNDGSASLVGTVQQDARRRRRLPGQGDFDLTGLVRLLDEMGVNAPYAVEVMSEDLAAMDVEQAAAAAFGAASAVLEKARSL
ncbi:MAG TPA: sugar phosphate isomerase/epimerase family protein [Dehalococcoidia bacterium]|nr:sugar phosphate isomerase/epimerase family protein [Dehalococcoidia bacterium]